jgi:hypothetical protein
VKKVSKKTREAEPDVRKIGLSRQPSEDTVDSTADDASVASGGGAVAVGDGPMCLELFNKGMEQALGKRRGTEHDEGLIKMSASLRAGLLTNELSPRRVPRVTRTRPRLPRAFPAQVPAPPPPAAGQPAPRGLPSLPCLFACGRALLRVCAELRRALRPAPLSPPCPHACRLSAPVAAVLPCALRGGTRESTLAFETLSLLWISCGHGEDAAFVDLDAALAPFVLGSEEEHRAVCALRCLGTCCFVTGERKLVPRMLRLCEGLFAGPLTRPELRAQALQSWALATSLGVVSVVEAQAVADRCGLHLHRAAPCVGVRCVGLGRGMGAVCVHVCMCVLPPPLV